MAIELYNQDCLKQMRCIKPKSIDMILCDLPYGTTACSSDTIIPFEHVECTAERISTSLIEIIKKQLKTVVN